MGDEHLDTIPETESGEFIKFSVENLVLNPSEFEDLSDSGCDVPACDDFTTFSNILFDADYYFSSSDDESFSDEDISKEIYANPLFDEEIISMKIDLHHFNAESDLIESLLNHDSSIISSSSKICSLLDEFAGELILLKSVPSKIDETDCDPEEEFCLIEKLLNCLAMIPFHFLKIDEFAGELILLKSVPSKIDETDYDPEEEFRLIEKLLYDNSSPHPPEEFISENSDAGIESFSPFLIPVEDNNSFMEEIDLSFTPDDLIPPGIEKDDYDSKRDMFIFEELLSNGSLSLPENESFHFDIPSFPRPPAKPPDDDSGILTIKVVDDISELYVPMPRLLPTLASNQEKSPNLLSHRGLKAFQLPFESPMMIYGENTPILDASFLHLYPPRPDQVGGIGSS
nr:hypothetical protein [Tanacetum cinerariifolium]